MSPLFKPSGTLSVDERRDRRGGSVVTQDSHGNKGRDLRQEGRGGKRDGAKTRSDKDEPDTVLGDGNVGSCGILAERG